VTRWTAGGRGIHYRELPLVWARLLAQPRTAFESTVTPGQQGPAAVFAAAVAGVATASKLAVDPSFRPPIGSPWLGGAMLVGLVAVLIAPTALHLVAALETLVVVLLTDERGGVSETVQVVAFATAPCVFAGVPSIPLRVLCTTWGAALLIGGTAVVHRTDPVRALLAGGLPALIVFGYAYGGIEACRQVVEAGAILAG
jgi:hypothetical protein